MAGGGAQARPALRRQRALWISYKWLAASHGADKTGPLAGVPYDGADPKFADLYHDADCARFVDKLDWNDDGIPESWKRHYLDRMTDLIDKYQPDLLYTDGHLPFEDVGLKMVSHLYNVSAQLHGGQTEAVYTSKRPPIAPSAPACWTTSAASPTALRQTPGRPTPASANGTTAAARSTRRPRK